MTAPADRLDRMVTEDAHRMVDHAADVALTIAAWASLLSFAVVLGVVAYVAGAL